MLSASQVIRQIKAILDKEELSKVKKLAIKGKLVNVRLDMIFEQLNRRVSLVEQQDAWRVFKEDLRLVEEALHKCRINLPDELKKAINFYCNCEKRPSKV